MSTQPKHWYTVEEYLALEKASETRYEYWNGDIYCMSGAKTNHNRITVNVTTSLSNQLANRSCEVFNEGQRLKVPAAPPFRYPDASVVCGEPVFEDILGLEALVNPILIVEVLSPTSENYDKGQKFMWYQSIPSFREYLLIHQDRVHVIQYRKQEDETWISSETTDLNATIELPSINCTLALSDVYRRVKFEETSFKASESPNSE